MSELNHQQLCVALGLSESTIQRLEQLGLPYTPVGARSHRYDLEKCKAWLKASPPGATAAAPRTSNSRELSKTGRDFSEACRNVRLRVMPSEK